MAHGGFVYRLKTIFPEASHLIYCNDVLNTRQYTIGAQGMLHQDVPQWPTDHFELKWLEKKLVQEGHSHPPIPLPKPGNDSPMWKLPSLDLEGRRYPYPQR